MTLDLTPFLPPGEPFPNRVLVEVDLKPVQGSRFQPTGFPDLGAAVFETKDGAQLLVESAQSMANRLESVCWDGATAALIPSLQGLSYVRVVDKDGSFRTSSILEAHRLNSPYILDGIAGKDPFLKQLKHEVDAAFESRSIDRRVLAKLVARYDMSALLHGLFLAKTELAGGRLRIERALSGFIEASGVRVAASGGVKNDQLTPSTDKGSARTAKEGFGNVPFQRDEYTADRIVAFFSLDLSQIRAYGLGPAAERLLVAMGLFKIRALLDGGLRLRTACDLEVDETAGGVRVTRPTSVSLPALGDLRATLPQLVAECAPLFAGEAGITTVRFES